MAFRRAAVAIVAAVVTCQPLSAQGVGDDEPFYWRKYAFAAVGGLMLGGVASLSKERESEAVCSSRTCVIAMGATLGSGLGFILGYELDGRARARWRAGPTLPANVEFVELGDAAVAISRADDGVIALNRGSVGLVGGDLRYRSLLAVDQPRAAVLVPSRQYVVVATSSVLLGTPWAGDGADTLSERGAAAVASLGDGALALSEPGAIRRVSLTGEDGGEGIREDERLATEGVSAALVLGGRGQVLWTVSDSTVHARDPRTLAEVGRITLPGRGQRLTVAGSRAIVSMGQDGAALLDISDPGSPRLSTVLSHMDFAYGATSLDGRIYVAAGPQGIFVYEQDTAGGPRRLGVIRELGFAADVIAQDGALWALDRERAHLYRIQP